MIVFKFIVKPLTLILRSWL